LTIVIVPVQKAFSLFTRRSSPTDHPRIQAKVVATETALEVAHRVYEVTGSSSTRSEVGLDLFWRNIRTHSLHDPLDYKKLEVGAHYLTGDVAPITLYT
jgi:alkylation response protein AidB-like acyl-CoA dehydrogenase